MRIAAIDDESGALSILIDSIKKANSEANIEGFNLAKKALERHKESPFDIVFVDIMMADMNGIDLAKKMKEVNKNLNIIFVTGYSEYQSTAIVMHASGYILKPVTKDKVIFELMNLLNPLDIESDIFAKTFGNFDLFVKGKNLKFSRAKSREFLAYLIDREGASVSKKELAAALFEDKEYTRNTQTYLVKIYASLLRDLKEAQIERILVKENNSYAVDINAFVCDAYEYLRGNINFINRFHGEYMSQYSWSEYSINKFYE